MTKACIIAGILLIGIFMILCLWFIGNDGGKTFNDKLTHA